MWLTAPGGQPLIMVYFHGPENWHKTEWKFDSKIGKNFPAWVEFTSDKVTLRVGLDSEAGQAQVQSEKVSLHDANTFLVLKVLDPKHSQVVPLGTFELRKSTDQPASVRLLGDHPELVEKINKAVTNAGGS